MKRTVLTASLSLLLTGGVLLAQQTVPAPDAQQPPPAQEHKAPNPKREAKHLTKELSLTPDQEAKIEPIFADRDQKIEALRSNTALTPQDMHKQMHAIQKSTQEQLSGILTPDQLEQMKTLRKDHGQHGTAPAAAPQASTPAPPSGV